MSSWDREHSLMNIRDLGFFFSTLTSVQSQLSYCSPHSKILPSKAPKAYLDKGILCHNRPTPPSQPTMLPPQQSQLTLATVATACQIFLIIVWSCFFGSQIYRVFVYLKETRCWIYCEWLLGQCHNRQGDENIYSKSEDFLPVIG
jgi:hypothetical protein